MTDQSGTASTMTPGRHSNALSARRAWLTLVCTPLGVVLAFFVPYLVADVIDAPFAASPSQDLTLLEGLALFVPTVVVAAGLPALAFAFALRPAKTGSRSGRVALAVSGLLVLALSWLCAASIF